MTYKIGIGWMRCVYHKQEWRCWLFVEDSCGNYTTTFHANFIQMTRIPWSEDPRIQSFTEKNNSDITIPYMTPCSEKLLQKQNFKKSCMKLQKMPCWLSLQKDYLLLALEKRLLWYLNVFSDEIKSSSTVEIFFKEIRKWWPTDCDCHICRTYISKIGYIT